MGRSDGEFEFPAPATRVTDNSGSLLGYSFFVAGTPRPQGSGALLISKSTGRTFKKQSSPMVAWRNVLVETFMDAEVEMVPSEVPVEVNLTFWFARPKGHSRVRAQRDQGMKSNGPDIDKLSRLVLDALTVARVLNDDRQVSDLSARKRYVEDGHLPEGVAIRVSILGE